MNHKLFSILFSFLSMSAVTTAALGEEMKLYPLRFSETRDVKFDMLATPRVPGAEMKAQVKFEEGQFRIELEYKGMKPAVLFGGDTNSYVLWAINRDGVAQNLGEFWVRPGEENSKLQFSTGLRNFALVVTGEAYFQVVEPSEMVIFWNDRNADPPVGSDEIVYNSFGPAPARGVEDIGSFKYDGKKPLDLLQAEKVFEKARGLGAEKYAEDIFGQASISLEQATHMYTRSRGKGAERYARRSVAASNEAISLTLRKIEIEKLEDQISKRQAEMTALANRASAAEEKAQTAERQIESITREQESARQELGRIETEKQSLVAERAQLESSLEEMRREQANLRSSMQELRVEKVDLQGRLQSALSEVADTRESARGFIVNLPDILFDVGEATLKPDATIALAKLAGILLIMQDLNLRVEGHTDSTGTASFNLRLSERRADSVFDFLAEQGIRSDRMKTAGYGMERPLASNSTADGRSKNRRVEIIIAEGVVAEG